MRPTAIETEQEYETGSNVSHLSYNHLIVLPLLSVLGELLRVLLLEVIATQSIRMTRVDNAGHIGGFLGECGATNTK